MSFSREDLEKAMEVLYDYEYIDLDKFYNCKENYKLLEQMEKGDEDVLEYVEEALQHFLDFETNYNLTIGDMLI